MVECNIVRWRGVLSGLLVLAVVAAVPGQPAAQPGAGDTVGAATAANRIVTTVGSGQIIQVAQPLSKVWVSAPAVADASLISPVQVLVSGKAPGMTQVVLWDKNNLQTIYEVLVEMDVSPLAAAIKQSAPDARVEVRALRSKILLRGTVPDVDTAQRILELAEAFTGGASPLSGENKSPSSSGQPAEEKVSTGETKAHSNVVNHMIVAGEQQVLLRCTVAEVNKRSLRQLGINGWLGGENFKDAFAVNQIGGVNPVNIGAAGGMNIRQNVAFVTDQNGLNLLPASTLSLGFPRVQMQLFMRAMRENDLLKVLAEPNLVSLNGQKAEFLAGGEFPVPVPQGTGGGTTITIEWKKFGILLNFTPTVIGRQMIRLSVRPEVSELDPSNGIAVPGSPFVVPALRTRSAQSTIELASGTTIAIAGLLNDQVRAVAQKVPALGDVPVLGALFSSVEYQRNITELVVLVTPELVSAMSPDQVPPVPGQFVTEPNDWELFGLGMIEGQPLCDESTPADALGTAAAPQFQKYTCPPEQMSLHGPWGPAESGEAKVE